MRSSAVCRAIPAVIFAAVLFYFMYALFAGAHNALSLTLTAH